MLSRLDGVRVASRGSSFAYRASPLDVRRIGTELGVTSVLEGTCATSGRSGPDHGRLDRRPRRVPDLGGDLRPDARRHLRHPGGDRRLGRPGVERSARRPGLARRRQAPGAEAYDMYLQGPSSFLPRRDSSETKRAITLFQEATRIAPNYCLALAGLADACSFLHLYYEPHPRDPGRRRVLRATGRRCRCRRWPRPTPLSASPSAPPVVTTRRRSSFGSGADPPRGTLREQPTSIGRTLFCAGETLDGSDHMFGRAVSIRPEDFHATALLAKMLRCARGRRSRSLAMQRRVNDLVDYHLRLVPTTLEPWVRGPMSCDKGGSRRCQPAALLAASAIALAGQTATVLAGLLDPITAPQHRPATSSHGVTVSGRSGDLSYCMAPCPHARYPDR